MTDRIVGMGAAPMRVQDVIRIDAPIVPGQELGVRLLTPISALEPLLRRAMVDHIGISAGTTAASDGWFRLSSPFTAQYNLGVVQITVDVRTGLIVQLVALPGYQGTLFNAVAPGISVSDAQRMEPRIYYDEGSEFLWVRGADGVKLFLDVDDPDVTDIAGLAIAGIAVFADGYRFCW
ncbi:MAG: hypothetical protein U0531_08775 [Dehalococcoidia bacterium]